MEARPSRLLRPESLRTPVLTETTRSLSSRSEKVLLLSAVQGLCLVPFLSTAVTTQLCKLLTSTCSNSAPTFLPLMTLQRAVRLKSVSHSSPVQRCMLLFSQEHVLLLKAL